jgi:tetratricopeptide (TPR) repeat protein
VKRVGRAIAVVGLSLALLGLGGLGLLKRIDRAPAMLPRTGRALQSHPVIPGATLAELIGGLQARIRAFPEDGRAYADLGLAYVQQARITADPSYYPKAEGVLDRSLALGSSGNFAAMTGMAALAAARHDFAAALSWSRRAVGVNPFSADAQAVMGDALVELGRYPEAFSEFQRMIDLRPELSTYARVSYALELQGDVPGAVRAMKLALEAAGSRPDVAWAANQLGDLHWNSGHIGFARSYYRRAIQADPSFIPARAGLARVDFAKGDVKAAIRGYAWVVERYPLPEYVIALGDLYTKAGDPESAARAHDLVRAEERLFETNGVNVDLEIALFDADHNVDVAAGLARARAEWNRRRSIHVADALAWTLYASGRHREALGYANRALALGTRSALFFFHRGIIEEALGLDDAAKRDLATALRINPRFSILWSERAARVLVRLGGTP